jgi:hypothetical protein
MRGPRPGFWLNYEKQQLSLVASCMPLTAVVSGDKPLTAANPRISAKPAKVFFAVWPLPLKRSNGLN